MHFTNIAAAKASLSKLIEMATHGEDVVIAKAGKPVVRIVRYDADPRPRQGGQWKGRVTIRDDFDELPGDILAVMEGRAP
jgi:prevent-host-death family protein